jgi:acetyl-CoA synthetase
MAFDFETYDQAVANFDWSEKWEVFDGSPDSFNIAHECLERHDDAATALRIIFDDGSTAIHAFGEVDRLSSQFANFLADRGVEKGDRVAVMLEPRLELYACMFGTMKRGAVYVPLYYLFGPDAIEYRMADSDASVLVTTADKDGESVPTLDAEVVHVEGFELMVSEYPTTFESDTGVDDLAIVQYTSGTTGQPKGTEMPHKAATNLAPILKLGYGLQPEDRFMCVSPVAWAHGIWIGTIGPVTLGNAAGAYSGKFDPETVVSGLVDLEITNMTATATALRKLVRSGHMDDYDLSLERIATVGEKMDTDTYQRLQDITGARVADIYGVSEYGGVSMDYLGFEDWEVRLGSIGKPFPGMEVAVIDEEGEAVPTGEVGEIAVRRGDGWFRTGDAGMVDEDGYYWHKGRMDDVIISSGYRIGPHEVEDALMNHDDVDDVAVVASPDDERGNIVKAFVRTSLAETDDLKAELRAFVKSELSKHEYPREIEFVDEFPRTTTSNKIKRKELRERERERADES